ncbi:MAG TPA: tetratricopeptide repeat protein [Deltaproteobacteria bacterium]|nr:tetratricopeptide repeat protein [Deltaproteobacteria bacterium]
MSRCGLVMVLVIIASTCLILSGYSIPAQSDDFEESDAILKENLLPAQQGDPQAQVFVGYLYETGQGVQQDYTRAAQWYWKAAEQGNAIAQYQLGNMYHLGKGITQNYILAYMWLDLAARGGNLSSKEVRRIVASKMSPGEIAEAKRMADEWKPKRR